jgi:hypothetical protein
VLRLLRRKKKAALQARSRFGFSKKTLFGQKLGDDFFDGKSCQAGLPSGCAAAEQS